MHFGTSNQQRCVALGTQSALLPVYSLLGEPSLSVGRLKVLTAVEYVQIRRTFEADNVIGVCVCVCVYFSVSQMKRQESESQRLKLLSNVSASFCCGLTQRLWVIHTKTNRSFSIIPAFKHFAQRSFFSSASSSRLSQQKVANNVGLSLK